MAKIDAQEAGDCIVEAEGLTATANMKGIVNLYNAMAKMLGEPEVNKFTDRATAMKRIAKITETLKAAVPAKAVEKAAADLEANTQPKEKTTKVTGSIAAKVAEATVAATTAKAERARVKAEKAAEKAALKAAGGAKRGKVAEFTGMTLKAVKDKNHRRNPSHGFNSMEIILQKPGIKYEDFIAAGGRNVDLRWDIKFGHVLVSEPKKA
jgi:hypothetical protein